MDQVTGLQWSKDGNLIQIRNPEFDTDYTEGDGAVIWQHALDYVTKLNNENYLGYNDWRLPNRNELQSIVDYSRIYNPAFNKVFTIDVRYFPNTERYYYWSSTTQVSGLGDCG
jgi:hypothetical protein